MLTKLTATAHPCWRCGGNLNQLDPAVLGWSYHCPKCQFLTSPRDQLQRALAENGGDAIGVVAGVPCRIDVVNAAD